MLGGVVMSLFSFLGASKDHYNNAADYFSKAKESAGNIVSNLWAGVSNIDSQTVKNTAVATGAAWYNYEHIAGKIISTNAAINLAKCFSANTELSMAAKVTQCAVSALVTNPVGCMVGLMATTVLAAKTAFYTSAAAVEATVGSVLYVGECVSDALSYTAKCISDAVMSDFTIDLSGEFAEIGILTC